MQLLGNSSTIISCLGRFLSRRVTVKAGLAYIIGDNLGQHTIAELNQAFSCANICHWCKISYICCDIICDNCDNLYNFMFVSDLTNHSVRSGVDLLLSLLTVPQKLHSRQYGIHSKRMNTHVNSSWVSRHLGEGKVSSCFYMIQNS